MLRHLFHALTAAVAAFIVYAAVTLWSILSAVREFQGLCPAAGPDSPAHPCTAQELATQMTFGAFSRPGHLMLLSGWIVAWLVIMAAVKWLRGKGDRAPLLRRR